LGTRAVWGGRYGGALGQFREGVDVEGQQGSVGREWIWRGTRAVLGGSGCCVLVRVHVEELRHRHSWWPGNRERGSRQEIQTEADTDRGRYRQRIRRYRQRDTDRRRYRQRAPGGATECKLGDAFGGNVTGAKLHPDSACPPRSGHRKHFLQRPHKPPGNHRDAPK